MMIQASRVALELTSAEFNDNREFILRAVSHDGQALEWASAELKEDHAIVLEAAPQDWSAAPADLAFDKHSRCSETAVDNVKQIATLEAASENCWETLRGCCTAKLQAEPESFSKAALQENSSRTLPPALLRDREIVLRAVSQKREALPRPHEIVLEAVSQDGEALKWASPELQGNREFVLTAMSQNGEALQWASAHLRGDHEIVLRAVSQSWEALKYAAEELKGDPEIVLQAVSQDGGSLRWASQELKANREIVLRAVKQNWEALMWASTELRRDREVVIQAVSQSWEALSWASDELRDDLEIVSQANFGTPAHALVLRVRLLSGRCCTLALHIDTSMPGVKRQCAKAFGLDMRQCVSKSMLVPLEGGDAICSLKEFEAGKIHEVTLVLCQ